MSNIRMQDIFNKLGKFIERKEVPQRLKSSSQAESDEMKALVRAVARKAPYDPGQFLEWWHVFIDNLGETCGNYWPNERDIAQAADKTPKPQSFEFEKKDEWKANSNNINANRMNNGQPVSESALFGLEACYIILKGLVSKEVMEGYRKSEWHNRASIYGEHAANIWLEEMQEVHKKAKAEVLSRRYNKPIISQAQFLDASSAVISNGFDDGL